MSQNMFGCIRHMGSEAMSPTGFHRFSNSLPHLIVHKPCHTLGTKGWALWSMRGRPTLISAPRALRLGLATLQACVTPALALPALEI